MNGWQSLGFKNYQEYLNSNLWMEKAHYLKEQCNFRCQKCGKRQGQWIEEEGEKPYFVKIIVHHLNYNNVGNEEADDLIVLCSKCHEEEHNAK